MPDVPEAAIQAAAIAIERELMSGKDYPMAQDSDEALARAALEAAAPLLADACATAILGHMEAHGPAPASPGVTRHETMRRAWRRNLRIAAQVASVAFSTEDDKKRIVAEALVRGDAVVCNPPEVPGEHGAS
jgi:hypothetical protein